MTRKASYIGSCPRSFPDIGFNFFIREARSERRFFGTCGQPVDQVVITVGVKVDVAWNVEPADKLLWWSLATFLYRLPAQGAHIAIVVSNHRNHNIFRISGVSVRVQGISNSRRE